MNKNLIILEYQNNFADNISQLAYKNIIENNSHSKCYFENITENRKTFENKMSYFSFDYDFISSAKVQNIVNNAHNLNKLYISRKEIRKNKKIKNGILNLAHFQIEDRNFLSDDFINQIKFNSHDFVKSYDILENITTTSSIGLYINKNDVNSINYTFIKNAVSRINKYVKKPILYIFCENNITKNLNLNIDFKVISTIDWKEEFYLLKSCKHKIIPNLTNSYSQNYWAAILNEKEYLYVVYDKNLKQKVDKLNWIEI